MIIVCQKCDARLQVDEAKVPARPFTIRCPKCNSSIESGLPTASTESQMMNDPEGAPLDTSSFEQSNPAPLFQVEQKAAGAGPDNTLERLTELLAGLANQSPLKAGKTSVVRPTWDTRKALICIQEEHRERVARSLSENGYQVFVALDTRQAVDRMRENLLDLVLLDSRFDPVEQGAVFVTREVNILRPAQRRRRTRRCAPQLPAAAVRDADIPAVPRRAGPRPATPPPGGEVSASAASTARRPAALVTRGSAAA